MTYSTRSVLLSSFVAFIAIGSGCGVQLDDPARDPEALASSERALSPTRGDRGEEDMTVDATTVGTTTSDAANVDAVKAPCTCDTFGRTTTPCPAQPTAADVGKWCGGGVTTACRQIAVCHTETCRFEAYVINERIAAGVPRYEAVLISGQIGWCK